MSYHANKLCDRYIAEAIYTILVTIAKAPEKRRSEFVNFLTSIQFTKQWPFKGARQMIFWHNSTWTNNRFYLQPNTLPIVKKVNKEIRKLLKQSQREQRHILSEL